MASKQRGKGRSSLITAALENGDVYLYWELREDPSGLPEVDGGALRIEHTALDGTAFVIYSNRASQATDRPLVSFIADNAAFDEAVLEVRGDGTAPALKVIGGLEVDTLSIPSINITGDITCDDITCDDIEINGKLNHDGTTIGFFGKTPVAKPSISGSRAGNSALTTLLIQLHNFGLIDNNTTA